MATSNTNSLQSHPTGGTALRGRIEAIGVFDLLRIAVSKGNTGRLLVFNDEFDAELYYVEGRLVAAIASSKRGRDALAGVFVMTEGEFEFAQDLVLPETDHDSALHDVMMAAIKSHYQERVRARQDSSTNIPVASKARNESLPSMPAVRISGTHLVSDDARIGVAPIVSIEKPPPAASVPRADAPPRPPTLSNEPLRSGEFGRATTDNAGRTTAKRGDISAQDTALATLASKTAQSVASILGMRDLQRLEIVGVNNRALLCKIQKEGIVLSVATNSADFDGIWKELET
jgi:hypothetical protein